MKLLLKVAGVLLVLLVLGAAGVAGAVLWGFYHFGKGLPEYSQLSDYRPPVMTRIHAGDGRLLAEYAIEKRVFVPIEAMPKRVISAFLSAEDKTFYQHFGIDLPGILGAVVINVRNLGTGRRPVGASTITQQVAKNFLLTNEVSFERKIKEAILAVRIERVLPKDRILELYLNEIYLGYGSYGVATAALNYFDKSMSELTTSEAAFLAALPKAPNNYDPVTRNEAAVSRRDWVIGRMLEDGHITEEEARRAMADPLVARKRRDTEIVTADYFTEEVRRQLADRYGETSLYKGGLSVRTTLDTHLQDIARRALRAGIEDYDRRHGWRGPVVRLKGEGGAGPMDDWLGRLRQIEEPAGKPDDWYLAAVLELGKAEVVLGFSNGAEGMLPFAEMRWARAPVEDQQLGPALKNPSDALAVGDVVLVEPVAGAERTFALRQMPKIQGGLVAMDPHTGRVLAMIGGFSYGKSQFNRATQAARQPGSAFKPFVYLAALENGYTPATIILDAPFVIDQGPGLPKWRPDNYTREFYGASTMRLGIEKSRNLMTVRLAQAVGMDKVAQVAEKFGVVDHLQETLAMSLGSAETSLLRMTTAYAQLVNGGKRIAPSLIDRIQDRNGRTIYRHDSRDCPDCRAETWTRQPVPAVPDTREQLADPASVFQIVSMLQGVVERGTGRRISELGRPLAGKTGTTNESYDAWFVGFSPDLAVGVFMGFDEPGTLGRKETGSSVAVPVFKDFMKEALEGQPIIPFRIPQGIHMVRVDAQTGRPAEPGDPHTILEAFKPGTVPTGEGTVLGGFAEEPSGGGTPAVGTGGLY